MIDIYLTKTQYCLGHWIEGKCQWFPETEDRKKKAILTVGWRTEGRGDVDQKSLEKLILPSDTLTPFRCQIPLTAPCTYDGELIRIIWEVKVEIKSNIPFQKPMSQAQVFLVMPPQTSLSR